jgi:hypothetical protein
MRYRLMATYQGVPYEAGIGPSEGDVVLFAACPPPEELGFEPATGHWRKQLRIADVQALWESRPMGTFRGEPCIILDELGDRLHIAYLGHDAYQAEQLGYWQVDRGVFELVTPRDEVIDLIEERADYPQRSGAAAQHLAPAAGTDTAASLGPALPAPGPSPAAADPGMTSVPRADFRTDSVPDLAAAPGFGSAPAPDPTPAPQYLTSPLTAPAGSEIPSGVAVPPYEESPLPLEAAALRATSAASRLKPPSPRPARQEPSPQLARQEPARQEPAGPPPSRRRGGGRRVATQRIFSELASLAAIPAGSYAVGAEVDGAMCLLQTDGGFEVFNAVAGARHEVRMFGDEESAYFYLFGVLAAEAVRTGGLVPRT